MRSVKMIETTRYHCLVFCFGKIEIVGNLVDWKSGIVTCVSIYESINQKIRFIVLQATSGSKTTKWTMLKIFGQS